MLSDITKGNAKKDGEEFRFWFVGQIEKWCGENNIDFDAEKYGLRNTADVEVKWGRYRQGEERDAWVACSEKTAMSILIHGNFVFFFREPSGTGECKEVRLENEGDYVIWREDVEHTWRMDADSEILTLRWRPGL